MDPDTARPSRRAVLSTAAASATIAVTASSATATGAAPGSAHASPARSDRRHRIRETVALPDGLRPEGITSGPGTTYYVGSLADGRIVTADLLRGRSRTLWPGETGRALRGLYWDRRTRLVWAVGNLGPVSHVWAIDDRSGAVVSDTEVPGAAFLNDLVVTDRRVWVTDSRIDRLTHLRLRRGGRPTGAPASFLPLGGDWPVGNGMAINANGIRELPDGSLVLNNSRVGGLWRVSSTTGRASAIPVIGGPGIVAGDGLVLDGRTLYNVRGSGNAEVAVVRLTRRRGQWRASWVAARTDPDLDVPSTATVAGRWLWAVNARFGIPDPDTARYWITRLPTA